MRAHVNVRAGSPMRAPGPITLSRACVFALAVIPYAGTIAHGFVYDDEIAIQRQEIVRAGRVTEVFTTPYHAGTGGPGGTGLYRPVTTLTFVLEHALLGPSPAHFHAVNVLLHGAVAVLVLELSLALGLSRGGAVAAAALFAVHPVHVEAVAGIVGRADLLAALFVLGALVAFVRGRDARGAPTFAGLAMAALAYLAGLAAKEVAIAFPAIALAWEGLFRRRTPRPARELGALAAALTVPTVAYLAARAAVLGGLLVPGASVTTMENPAAGLPLLGRLATALAIAARYALLLVFPRRLSADWGFAQVTPVPSLLDPSALAGAALAALVVAGAVLGMRRSPVVPFACALGVAAWLPVSSIPFVVGVGMAERLLYLPSVAFCLLGGVLWVASSRRVPARTALVAASVLLVPLTLKTVSAASAWRDELTLFAASERSAPTSIRVLNNLGVELAMRGRTAEALERIERAAALAPDHVATALNLGAIRFQAGDLDGSREAVDRVLALEPRNAVALAQRGAIFRAQGRLDEAVRAFRDAVAADPSFVRARLDLAGLLVQREDLPGAREELEAVLKREPGSVPALHGLGIIGMREGRRDEAVKLLEEAARRSPADSAIADDLKRARDGL